jgi:hypothetical protein
MVQNFLSCDRDQELLLPPSLREWLAEDHKHGAKHSEANAYPRRIRADVPSQEHASEHVRASRPTATRWLKERLAACERVTARHSPSSGDVGYRCRLSSAAAVRGSLPYS